MFDTAADIRKLKSADDILATLADYCWRVPGAGRQASGRPADPVR